MTTDESGSRQATLARRKLLVELIEKDTFSSQGQLQERLAEQGMLVNQATLSRDLRQLGIVKLPLGRSGSRYALPGAGVPAGGLHAETFRRHVHWIGKSGSILLLKTGPGHAGAAALALDNMKFPGILGTVAGDDTFIALVEEGWEAEKVRQELLELSGLPSQG
jgi:transcriptional regulator of arginine metabolism